MLKFIIVGIVSLTMLGTLLSKNPYSNLATPTTKGENKFLNNLQQYAYYIEGVGAVNFKTATLKDGKLTTEYYYFSEGENRTGMSSHQLQENGKYVGNWKTTADNGNVYEGKSWLRFNKDGTASGEWTWKGMPGEYEIRIDKIGASIEEK